MFHNVEPWLRSRFVPWTISKNSAYPRSSWTPLAAGTQHMRSFFQLVQCIVLIWSCLWKTCLQCCAESVYKETQEGQQRTSAVHYLEIDEIVTKSWHQYSLWKASKTHMSHEPIISKTTVLPTLRPSSVNFRSILKAWNGVKREYGRTKVWIIMNRRDEGIGTTSIMRERPTRWSVKCVHFAFPGLHFTLRILHFILQVRCTLHFAVCTVHSTLFTLHSTPCTVHFALQTKHFTFHTSMSIPVHFTVDTLHFALRTSHSTLCTRQSCTLQIALRTLHSTLHTLDL